MLNTQERLGNSLLKNLIGLREAKGVIKIEDVGAILQGMASSLQNNSDADRFLKHEIERMVEHIITAKDEIHQLIPHPEEGAPKNINAASAELSEVVKATEEATNTIMDVADIIQKEAASLPDSPAKAKIIDVAMQLYDACSFQDITGQRVNKVIKTLESVEERVVTLLQLFGGKLPEGYVPPERLAKIQRADEALMNGPQMGDDMPSQEEIDNLFKGL